MIYLVRHGETEWNVIRRAQGRLDSPLTERGVRQARAMAELLAGLVAREPGGAWRLVASPLGRARQTARIVGERLGLPVEIDERLREHSMGELDGLRAEALRPRLPTGVPDHEQPFHVPGGESFDEISARARSFLAEAAEDDRLIAVSHGVLGRILRGVYAGLDRETTLTIQVGHSQEHVFRLAGGQVDALACEPVTDS